MHSEQKIVSGRTGEMMSKKYSGEYVQWREELGCIIPESVLDQFEVQYGQDSQKQVQQIRVWMEHTNNKVIMQNHVQDRCRCMDLVDYLSISLKLPAEDVATNADTQEQIFSAVCSYLNQKKGILNGSQCQVPTEVMTGHANKLDYGYQGTNEQRRDPPEKGSARKGGGGRACRDTDLPVPPGSQTQVRKKISEDLKTYEFPLITFKETEAYASVLSHVVSAKKNKVIHIHGTPGNGKSQIVRSVCYKFDLEGVTVICHVQCMDSKPTVINAWQNLIKKLELTHGKSISGVVRAKVVQDLEVEKAQHFITALQQLGVMVLLVIEDATHQDRKVVRDAINHMLRGKPSKTTRNPVKLLVATNKMDSIFSTDEIAEMNEYHVEKIKGFTQTEAVEFLCRGTTHSARPTQQEFVSKLAQELAYSPLRLTLVKSYCQKYGETYEAYYNTLGKDSDIIEMEKKIAEEHPELAAAHGYEIIMKAVKAALNPVQLNVFYMASFLWNEDIPDYLLGSFVRQLDEFPEAKNYSKDEERKWVSYMIEELESVGIVTSYRPAERYEYGALCVSTHMDIFHAVRMNMQPEMKQKAINGVFHALLKLAKKDNRVRFDRNVLFNLMNHINQFIPHVSNLLEADLNNTMLSEFSSSNCSQLAFQIQMGLSWLFEVLGFINTQHARAKDEHFGKSIDWLWGIVCYYGQKGKFMQYFTNKNHRLKEKHLLEYAVDKIPTTTATEAYMRIRSATQKIQQNIVADLYSQYFCIDKAALLGIKSHLGNENDIPWDEWLAKLEKGQRLSEEEIGKLQEFKMVLSPEQLKVVFLAESISSVLHSRGRQVLMLKDSISADEQRRYEWYRDVGLEIVRQMSQDTGIKSTFEYIILANNKLPRMVQNRHDETDEQFVQRLQAARTLAKELFNVQGDFYEKGIYKRLAGTPYSLLNAMKYVVKANTKIYKRPEVARQNPVPDALVDCDAAYHLAKQNAKAFAVASNVMVHVAKYYAVTEHSQKAFEAIENAFEYDGVGLNRNLESNPKAFAWAAYNYGRVILECGRNAHVLEKWLRFESRCEMVLRNGCLDEELKQLLMECKEKVKGMNFQSES